MLIGFLQRCTDFVSRDYRRRKKTYFFLLRISANELSPQTIVSTILPTISSDFSASQLEYTWVGVAYMLTQTAFQPLYGKISDLLGRKVSPS